MRARRRRCQNRLRPPFPGLLSLGTGGISQAVGTASRRFIIKGPAAPAGHLQRLVPSKPCILKSKATPIYRRCLFNKSWIARVHMATTVAREAE